MASPLDNQRASKKELDEFIERVWLMGATHARHDLPWRFLDDPYAVFVSEVMLQQTQVSRVFVYWPRWMAAFPTVDALSSASTSDVLELWQGLGYNRRALNIKRAADICSIRFDGSMPCSYDELVALPGIGPATAAGIMAFAYQLPSVYIETNVRAVFIHEFFSSQDTPVTDAQIRPLVERSCSRTDPRGWYYALLDYGHFLKVAYPNPSRKSSTYARQSAFEGSHRQKRAMLVREVVALGVVSVTEAKRLLDEYEASKGRSPLTDREFDDLVAELCAEGFMSRSGSSICV